MPEPKPTAVNLLIKRGYMSGVDVHITLADGRRAVLDAQQVADLALAELNRRGFTLTLAPGQKLYRLKINA